ncbi:hypothetical protein BC628DRAFT_1423810 [Trametes gibbosa]|nr:hypothetical protein BC628DRAFT_1423810 [Trametes gibbosa]
MQTSEAPSWTPLRLTSLGAVPAPESPSSSSTNPPSALTGAWASRTGAPRKRCPQAVYDILSAYFYDVNQYPTKEERIKLAEQVSRIRGAEDYTQEKVQHYFMGKRQSNAAKASRKAAQSQAASQAHSPAPPPGPPSSAHILYPSLASDPSVIPKLDVLLRDTPEPSPTVLKIWAGKLGQGVLTEDITTYAELRRAERRPGKVYVRSPSQLPTPESSTSPEPLVSPTSPSDFESDSEEVKPKLVPPSEKIVPRTDPRIVLIANELHEALSTPPSPPREGETPPKSFAELSRWFQAQKPEVASVESHGKPRTRQWPDAATKTPPQATLGGRTLA